MKGEILLARPNSFIVKHMKQLVEDSGNIPHAIKNIRELDLVDKSKVKGIVISTSVSSVVGESYFDVLKKVEVKFPGKPIFLASLTEVDAVKRAFKQREETLHLPIQSLEEAMKHAENGALVVIRKSDLTDPLQYRKTLEVFRKKVA